jgi:hypothetical protein
MSNETNIRVKLATNPMWAIRGVLAIYANQTPNEQIAEETNVDNGIGFTGCDAKLLSSFAKQVQNKIDWVKSKNLPVMWDKLLSVKQMGIVFKKMPKYAKQLMKIAANKDTSEKPVEPVVSTFDATLSSFKLEHDNIMEYKGYWCGSFIVDDIKTCWMMLKPDGTTNWLQWSSYTPMTYADFQNIVDSL